MLVKEGEEAPSAPSRQNADRDAQAARRAGSYTSTLDKAMGPSGEGGAPAGAGDAFRPTLSAGHHRHSIWLTSTPNSQ